MDFKDSTDCSSEYTAHALGQCTLKEKLYLFAISAGVWWADSGRQTFYQHHRRKNQQDLFTGPFTIWTSCQWGCWGSSCERASTPVGSKIGCLQHFCRSERCWLMWKDVGFVANYWCTFWSRSLKTDPGFDIKYSHGLGFLFALTCWPVDGIFRKNADKRQEENVQIKAVNTLNLLPPRATSLFLCFPLHFQQVQTENGEQI